MHVCNTGAVLPCRRQHLPLAEALQLPILGRVLCMEHTAVMTTAVMTTAVMTK